MDVEAMSPADLRARWEQLEGTPAPNISLALLRKLYAQRVREHAYGGIPEWVLVEFDRVLSEHRRPKPEKRVVGSRRFLYHLLSNPIYLGKIVHKGQVYPGEHQAIIPEELFNAVQAKLKDKASGSSKRSRAQHPSLLAGILFDSDNRPMTPSHASKGKTKRYRYYITRLDKADTSPVWRINAHDTEQITTTRIAQYLNSPAEIAKLAGPDIEATTLQNALAQADLSAATMRSGTTAAKLKLIQKIVDKITLHEDRIEITIDANKLRKQLTLPSLQPNEPTILTVNAARARRGHQVRLVIPSLEPAGEPELPKRDEKAILKLAEAFEARRLVMENPTLSLSAIAKAHRRCHKQLAKLVERSCLAPSAVIAALC